MSDNELMLKAVELAYQGKGYTKTNPCVGAVILSADGEIVGVGWHKQYGEAHAEINALTMAGDKAKGGTLYVTLEPCSTYGKTPPCTNAIIEAGIAHVVIGVIDPNPKHAGAGVRILKDAGIRVTVGVEKEACAALIEDFCKFIATGTPYVMLKIAQSIDGAIATHTGESRWITGDKAREKVHQLRAQADAVLIGVNTALADNPQLTVRLDGADRQPMRVVLDSKCRLNIDSHLVQDKIAETIVFTTNRAMLEKIELLRKNEVQVFNIGESIDLNVVLAHLGRLGVMNLLVEGGGAVFASFIDAHLADEVNFFIAPMIIGGDGAKRAIGGKGASLLSNASKMKRLTVQTVGEDIWIKGKL